MSLRVSGPFSVLTCHPLNWAVNQRWSPADTPLRWRESLWPASVGLDEEGARAWSIGAEVQMGLLAIYVDDAGEPTHVIAKAMWPGRSASVANGDGPAKQLFDEGTMMGS